ncbi:bifunctional diaminohydroxyphosphoribosylaminopyrimidine deaminase/5-amino-6-(5-phosphoribosylamino)uracil reductase RibD [Uliginosibacterium sp. TH139]|uniref:bifunctional diaminohydroxyphosphoribosylaminopyrimidine deaminase/5-amino-6-(5-phosphoribosylamino)uracil reductase RibD n=1 Tax=Uliginosibacterium sp. TH139 TaxID=2067453 RepID=UPI002110CB5E|nr:bifunctional diaminohydroxyphosphoribosylaminopyrimidine deaminase/5-amino-6-(5-phosphoribosylamino)uracil reductase RibD [Uliginosibacterium sp. TH139]
MFQPEDERFMARALELAARGLYTTMPNPRVGCVIVREGKIVGEGWHERAGEAHAEVHALRQAGALANGATAYVTLEPCSHFGRTPPCAQALINSGVRHVVCAMQDPNPLVAGRGLQGLREAGIETRCGLFENQARQLNEGFVARMERGRPWLRIKSAASLDGRTALANGVSQWITSPEARLDGQHWRARSCAILTGIGTVLADAPRLTVRDIELVRQPLRIIVDSQLRCPPDAAVLADGRALIVTCCADVTRHDDFTSQGVEVLQLPGADNQVDLSALLRELGRRGINEVITEAGAQLNGALITAGLADALLLYLAPNLLGSGSRGMFDLPALATLTEAPRLTINSLEPIGPDLRIQGQFKHN